MTRGTEITDELVEAARELARACDRLRFGSPVRHVYNPLLYAWSAHELYLRRYGGARAGCVLLGMNPGPWGMAQTGVPFGDVDSVRGWLGISSEVGQPAAPHPKKPVLGFGSRRREVSGSRLWGWARDRFTTPERFFSRLFVVNYCPLLFLDEGGRNLTPDRLASPERASLLAACDRSLVRTIAALQPGLVVGIGGWAETQARRALAGSGVGFGRILHPSPASPAANRGWAELAEQQLAALGVLPGT